MTANNWLDWPDPLDLHAHLRNLEADNTRLRQRAEVAEAEIARLEHDACSVALHDGRRDGRVGLGLLWRAVTGARLPWGGAA